MLALLERDGLSIDILSRLSYRSELGISLKKNLHYFSEDELLKEINKISQWYDNQSELHSLALDYRVKSLQSAMLKYRRYFPDHQARKVFDDLLGFRSLCDNYEALLTAESIPHIRIVDMSSGKANDDGYRGVHVYFQLDNTHYPIEIQYNTYYDRQLNNWLHTYLYKKGLDNSIGQKMRTLYEGGKITTEVDFKEELEHVLRGCQGG